MTIDKIALRELLEKGSDADLLREMINHLGPWDDQRERTSLMERLLAVETPEQAPALAIELADLYEGQGDGEGVEGGELRLMGFEGGEDEGAGAGEEGGEDEEDEDLPPAVCPFLGLGFGDVQDDARAIVADEFLAEDAEEGDEAVDFQSARS